MNAVDTNVLLYAHDPRDPVKRKKAISLLQSLEEGVLLWQVACEYIAASRKLESQGFSLRDAWRNVNDLRRIWATILPSWESLNAANSLLGKYHLSFWDAMIVAACLEANVDRLFTENFHAYNRIETLLILNPFENHKES